MPARIPVRPDCQAAYRLLRQGFCTLCWRLSSVAWCIERMAAYAALWVVRPQFSYPEDAPLPSNWSELVFR